MQLTTDDSFSIKSRYISSVVWNIKKLSRDPEQWVFIWNYLQARVDKFFLSYLGKLKMQWQLLACPYNFSSLRYKFF